jgi:hypothetical protein
MRFINYMRLFKYMRLIYHIARLMSREIFIALGDRELVESVIEQRVTNRK